MRKKLNQTEIYFNLFIITHTRIHIYTTHLQLFLSNKGNVNNARFLPDADAPVIDRLYRRKYFNFHTVSHYIRLLYVTLDSHPYKGIFTFK